MTSGTPPPLQAGSSSDLAGRLRRVPLPDEAVHLAVVDVGDRVHLAVRAAAVDVGGVVVGTVAAAGRVRHADRGHPMAHRDAVRPGIGAEVTVVRPVLLHDDDHVLDLVDALRHHIAAQRAARRRLGRLRRGARGQERGREQPSQHHAIRPDVAAAGSPHARLPRSQKPAAWCRAPVVARKLTSGKEATGTGDLPDFARNAGGGRSGLSRSRYLNEQTARIAPAGKPPTVRQPGSRRAHAGCGAKTGKAGCRGPIARRIEQQAVPPPSAMSPR